MKKILFVIIIDIFLTILIRLFFKPLCEPCLPEMNCLPCFGREEIIGYIVLLIINLIFAFLILKKPRSSKSE